MEAAPMLTRRTLTAMTALLAVPVALVLGALPAQAQKKTLVVALNQDPDILDPSPSRTYVGRIIFAQMCEKLYEIDENLRIFPQLAADMPTIGDGGKTVTIKLRPGVKFNDGTPMTAESVRYSLDRHLNMKGSNRRSELESVNSIDVVDPLTVRLRLKTPFSPLVAILADRSGMPVSPTAANKLGDKFGTAPVCVGPWQFVERISQDRIVLERSPHYFDKAAAKFDRLLFRIIPDDNVRLANLRSGDIDVMHLVGPTDAANLRKEGKFEVSSVTGIGYSGLTINLRNKNGKPPAPAAFSCTTSAPSPSPYVSNAPLPTRRAEFSERSPTLAGAVRGKVTAARTASIPVTGVSVESAPELDAGAPRSTTFASLPLSSKTLSIQASRLSPLVKTTLASAVVVTSSGRGS